MFILGDCGTRRGPGVARAMRAAIRPYESADLPSVVKLRRAAYHDLPEVRDVEFYDSVWRWLKTHPLGDEMQRWVAVDEDRVVAHLAATPQYYRVNGRRVVAHTPADYMALPEYGFAALSIMRKYFRSTENCVACDMVPAVITVESRLGAAVAGRLRYAAKLLDVSRVPSPNLDDVRRLLKRGGAEEPQDTPRPELPKERPRAPLPAPIKKLVNKGLHAVDEALGSGFGGGGLETEVIEKFDGSFDELFEEIAAVVPCVPEKDAAFLRWRYGPGSPTTPVTVLGVREGERLLGYAVLKVTWKNQDGYPLDLTTLPGRHDVARALIRDAVRHFRREGVEIIRYRFVESSTSARPADLWRMGFFPRDGRSNTLLTKFADHGLHETTADVANWSYGVGDGEATFWLR